MIFFQLPHHRSDSSVSTLFTVGYIPYGKFRDMNSKDSYHSLSFPKKCDPTQFTLQIYIGKFL